MESKKILYLGMIHNSKNKRGMPVFCNITIKQVYERIVLRITGVINPNRHGGAYSCGQIADSLKEIDNFASGWDTGRVSQFMEVWKKWHLNDLRAECEHQREAGWEKRLPDGRWTGHLWEKRGGILLKPCPVCGYKYGSAWLFEEIPADVLEYLDSLPAATRIPAWI